MARLFITDATPTSRNRLEGDISLTSGRYDNAAVILVSTVVCVLAAWTVFGTYTRTETVAGTVVPVVAAAKLYAERPGLITSVFVHDGDSVAAGSVVATVETEVALKQGGSPNASRLAALERQLQSVTRQGREEDAKALADQRRLTAVIADLTSERQALSHQIASEEEAVTSTRQQFDSYSALFDRGLTTRTLLETYRQHMLAAEQQLAGLISGVADLDSRLASARGDLADLPLDHASKAAELASSADDVRQRQIDAENNQQYVVKAPFSGKVTSIQATKGQFVDTRLPMLSVVPRNARMEVVLYAPSRAVGLARIGQPVKLLYDAFPVERFGSFPGRVVGISRTALSPTEVDAPFKIDEPVYRIRVAVDSQTIATSSGPAALSSGMTLRANIALDRRNFMAWLLEPLEAVRNRA